MKLLFGLFCVFVIVEAVSFIDLIQEEWNLFKIHYKKNYSSNIEDGFRLKTFLDNKKHVLKHNTRYERGHATFKMKLNDFADILPYEFTKRNGFNKSLTTYYKKGLGSTYIPPAHVTLPTEVDWRKYDIVTKVKNQGTCGSCWAFSTTGSLEGQHARKTGKLISLSEQNLVDCSTSYGNNGCNGGLMDNAFRYIKDNYGIDTEKSYPYEGDEEQCHFMLKQVGATDSGFVDIPQGDEDALKAAVATVGPVSVAIDASQRSFQFYSEGVYYDPHCDSAALDHGVLVVGYGTTSDEIDYWLVKNSWGPEWGKNGYIKMARNRDNHCGIASSASYPLV